MGFSLVNCVGGGLFYPRAACDREMKSSFCRTLGLGFDRIPDCFEIFRFLKGPRFQRVLNR